MKTPIKLIACALTFGAVTAFAGEDKKGEEVAVTDLPAAVTQSVAAKWPDATIANAKKATKDDEACYKVKVKSGDDVYVAWVNEAGTIKDSKEKEDKKD